MSEELTLHTVVELHWADEEIVTAVKRFIYNGGGFIGVGEPTAYQWEGRYFQLASALGVEKENGF